MFCFGPHFHISTFPSPPAPPYLAMTPHLLPTSTLLLLPPPLFPWGHLPIVTITSDILARTSPPSSCGYIGYLPAGALAKGRNSVLSCDGVNRRNVSNNELVLDAWCHLGSWYVWPMELVDSNLEVRGVMVEDGDPPPLPPGTCPVHCPWGLGNLSTR